VPKRVGFDMFISGVSQRAHVDCKNMDGMNNNICFFRFFQKTTAVPSKISSPGKPGLQFWTDSELQFVFVYVVTLFVYVVTLFA
jgi:hypothetical protein